MAAVLLLAACDRGGPSIEQWQRQLDIPSEQLWDVDERTKVTVVDKETVELWIFTPARFGGWQHSPWPTTVETVNGGTAGRAASLGNDPRDEATNYCYLFGGGQGPIAEVRAERLIRWAVVNPAIDGWVAVLSWEHGDDDALSWQLLAPDGEVLYEDESIFLPWGPCADPQYDGMYPSST